MAKVKISEFDVNPDNNTDINNINIAEGCAPSGINNAIRQLMSDLKAFQTGADGDPFNGAVNGTVGATTPATGAFTTLSASSTVSGTGFSTYLASPPAIGGTAAAAGNFTTLGASSTATLNTLSSSGATITGGSINGTTVGASTASTGAFTTLGASGVATFSAGTVSAPAITTTGDTNTGIYFPAADTIAFTEGGVESIRINSSGNLGIGTTNASERLVVQSGSILIRNDTDYLKFNNAADSTYWGRISQSSSDIELSNRQAGALKFLTTDTERMRITSVGNVGINISTPVAYTNFNYLTINGTNGAGIQLRNSANTVIAETAVSSSGYFMTAVTAHPIILSTTNIERMRITDTGNVGIGTSSPSARLDIVQSTNDTTNGLNLRGYTTGSDGGRTFNINTISSDANNWANLNFKAQQFTFSIQGTEKMRLDSSGNLGIGTSSPSEKLDVRGSIIAYDGGTQRTYLSNAGEIELCRTNGDAYIDFSTSTAEDFDCRIQQISNGLRFLTGGDGSASERMRIDSTGDALVGTTITRARLTVAAGDATGNGITIVNTNTGANTTKYSTLNYSGTDTVGTYKDSGYVRVVPENNDYVASAMAFATRSADTVAERMRITSAGNVGIGTSTPLEKLDVLGIFVATDANRQFVRLRMDSAVARIESSFASGASGAYRPLAFSTSDAERMRIDTSGNVGIGTSSPDSKLRIQSDNTSGTAFKIRDGGTPTGNLIDVSSGAYGQSLLLTASGNLLVGTTSSDARLHVLANAAAVDPVTVSNSDSGSNSQYAIVFRRNTSTIVGSIQTTNAATSYNTSSDYRLKENIAPMTGALAKVAALKPVTYDWKAGGSSEGFIAHELAEVCPDAVVGEKDAVNEDGSIKPQGVDTSFLVATLTAAIQELKAEVDALKLKINQ